MRVLLIEDDPELADGIATFLAGQGDSVVVESNGMTADRLLQERGFDFVLVDVALPGLGGYEIVRRIRERRQSLAVVMITARDALDDRIYGLDLGADDYLSKPFELAELTARMRAITRRGASDLTHSIQFGPLSMDIQARHASLADRPLILSSREWDLLTALATADGHTVAKEHLQADSSVNALEVYVCRLRRRLEVAGLNIRTVRGFGYRLEIVANIASRIRHDANGQ
ncbi:response regulator transcription factor [Accumulibacter sp.]|uniref:response regulator n=1 Tax=Accumulibacter sp. TaxID=2053492 RepID=UPI001E0A4A9C|nr:response regulator transcription factor [Accumulibacter sp.]MCB1965650.1 response regulator transcription factor [Accumulibacter sp.]MCP5228725.1 response regulator transcription factor [Accumulibacter sp.]